jgi:hypothetical protein
MLMRIREKNRREEEEEKEEEEKTYSSNWSCLFSASF